LTKPPLTKPASTAAAAQVQPSHHQPPAVTAVVLTHHQPPAVTAVVLGRPVPVVAAVARTTPISAGVVVTAVATKHALHELHESPLHESPLHALHDAPPPQYTHPGDESAAF